MNLRDIKFADATPEQFREFWEGEGWIVASSNGTFPTFACKYVRLGSYRVEIREHGLVYFNESFTSTFTTFGEALDAMNELANTKIMGGWA